MSKQDQALHLADALEEMSTILDMGRKPDYRCKRRQAANELRRLHAENEAAHAVGIRQEQELMNCVAQRDELLVALKRIEMAANATLCNAKWVAEHAKAAIAKVEGSAA